MEGHTLDEAEELASNLDIIASLDCRIGQLGVGGLNDSEFSLTLEESLDSILAIYRIVAQVNLASRSINRDDNLELGAARRLNLYILTSSELDERYIGEVCALDGQFITSSYTLGSESVKSDGLGERDLLCLQLAAIIDELDSARLSLLRDEALDGVLVNDLGGR